MTGDSPSEASPLSPELVLVRGEDLGACSAQPAGFLPGSSCAALSPKCCPGQPPLADSLHPRETGLLC